MTKETEALKKMYQILLTEPRQAVACERLEQLLREALAEHPSQPAQEPADSIQKASAYLEARLWEFVDMAAAWPEAKPDTRIWEQVMAYAPGAAVTEALEQPEQQKSGMLHIEKLDKWLDASLKKREEAVQPALDVTFLRQVLSVAIAGLYEHYKDDVLAVFDMKTLAEVVEYSEPLRTQRVEGIYKQAWDMLNATPQLREESAAVKTLKHLRYTYNQGAEFWKPPITTPQSQPKQEPVALDVTIDDEEDLAMLRDMVVQSNDDLTPIRLVVGGGHSGYGLYVESAEYPDEGSTLLVNTPPPAQPQQEPWCMKTNGCKTKCADCPDEPEQLTEKEKISREMTAEIVAARAKPVQEVVPLYTISLQKQEPEVCCGDYATCMKPCTPRGRWLAQQEPVKLWLWKNFVNGRPEYWAFDNAFPVNLDNGDPQTLGQPCGYALLKPSRQSRFDVSDEEVLRAVQSTQVDKPQRKPLTPEQKEAELNDSGEANNDSYYSVGFYHGVAFCEAAHDIKEQP